MILLRAATADDAPAIALIHSNARRDAMPYLPELHSDDETEAWVRDVVLPVQDVTVATLHDQVVAYIAVDGSTVESLYVRPDVQGRGVGSELLRRVMDRSSGELDLWTFQRNIDARRFYEARDFVAVEYTDGSENEEREPDVRYRWVRSERPDPIGQHPALREQ